MSRLRGYAPDTGLEVVGLFRRLRGSPGATPEGVEGPACLREVGEMDGGDAVPHVLASTGLGGARLRTTTRRAPVGLGTVTDKVPVATVVRAPTVPPSGGSLRSEE